MLEVSEQSGDKNANFGPRVVSLLADHFYARKEDSLRQGTQELSKSPKTLKQKPSLGAEAEVLLNKLYNGAKTYSLKKINSSKGVRFVCHVHVRNQNFTAEGLSESEAAQKATEIAVWKLYPNDASRAAKNLKGEVENSDAGIDKKISDSRGDRFVCHLSLGKSSFTAEDTSEIHAAQKASEVALWKMYPDDALKAAKNLKNKVKNPNTHTDKKVGSVTYVQN
ncbi:unnamed protein product [Enterobius vermicularis]|uniref:DRBM domain-containing protein n=1 Tax=Enterobius vermicularis TaxID=51028 RepID=A0A0N4VD65_ENTVE|nr:unnamed protein product [Enterobius vermicularis]